ncbi:MAG: DUF4326 domain-containing protein [Phycisphaerae bacterium]|nr:DUF4326 domain-containing protein [Phycisphaerae bacterium]
MSIATTPLRLQRSRRKGSRLVSPNELPIVCCSRPGRFGNPFAPGKPGPMLRTPIDGIGAIGFFRHMFRDREFREEADYPSLDELRKQLAGKHLACWCKLCPLHASGKPLNEFCPKCQPCHVDVLGELLYPQIAVGETKGIK